VAGGLSCVARRAMSQGVVVLLAVVLQVQKWAIIMPREDSR
jgi:hypothetical protein